MTDHDDTEDLCDAAEASAGTTPYISNADPISDVARLTAHARSLRDEVAALRAVVKAAAEFRETSERARFQGDRATGDAFVAMCGSLDAYHEPPLRNRKDEPR